MKSIKIMFLVAVLAFAFSGCGGSNFEALNSSDSGILIEKLLPKDSSFVVSITTRDADQRASFDEFIKNFPEGDGLIEKMQGGFADLGMDYETDVKPILGENGFRLVMAYSGTDTYAVMTVADEVKAQEWLDSMVARGEGTKTQLSDIDVYVTAAADGSGGESYTALLSDLLIVTGTSSALVNANGQLLSDDSESLLSNEDYMASVDKLEDAYTGYFYVNKNALEQMTSLSNMPSVLGMGSSLVSSQIFSFGFQDNAIEFYGYENGDKTKIDDLGFGFDEMGGDGMYLAENIPGDNLLFYEETGSFDKAIDLLIENYAGDTQTPEAAKAEISTYVTQYLGMDFEKDLMSFLDKGYVISVNGGGDSVLPGISIVVDVSSNVDAAKEFMDKIDVQLSTVVALMQYDATGAGSAFSQSDLTVMESDFREVAFDLKDLVAQDLGASGDSVASVASEDLGTSELAEEEDLGTSEDSGLVEEGTSEDLGTSELAEEEDLGTSEDSVASEEGELGTSEDSATSEEGDLNSVVAQMSGVLIYGVTEDGLMIISTYPEWELFDGSNSVLDSENFASANKWLGGYGDTIFFLDMTELVNYLNVLESFSSLVGGSVSAENADGIKSYLEMFKSVVFGTEAEKYDVEIKGRVEVGEERI
ncbi:MAG: DUF3352 domain-containing protein [Candidatus Gracilibacteria bacterium]